MTEAVGRYEIVSGLRAGGMARVDLARLRGPYDFCRYVVIKRPLLHQASDPVALEQFRMESRLLAGLHHPSVISFVEAGVDTAGVDFIALEYVHGMSLRDLAPPRGPQLAKRPSLAASLTIAKEIADALQHAHDSEAVVHRDVSPSNVLLGYDGSIKLIDFGVAKLTEGATASGALRGKITYMAPEQCRGEVIDGRADVYGLGVILYELVTGTRPFYAADDIASLHKIVSGERPPHAKQLGVDAALADIIMRAMAHRASERYGSAAELAVAIEGYAAAHDIALSNARVAAELGEVTPEPWRNIARAIAPATVASPAPVKRRWPFVVVAASAVVVAASVVIYMGFVQPAVAPVEPATIVPETVEPTSAPSVTAPAPEEVPGMAAAAPEPAMPKRTKKKTEKKVEAKAEEPEKPLVVEETKPPPAEAKPAEAKPGVWNRKSFGLPKKTP